MASWPIDKQAEQLHREALVWDMVYPIEPWCGNGYDKLQRYRDSGASVVSLCLAGDNHNISEAVQRIASARTEVLKHPQHYVLVETLQDIRSAQSQGKLAIAFHLEGTRCFERNLELIESFYQLGIRHALLAFNQTNSVGGGCAEKNDSGLSNFGERLVREMQRVGMVVDLSHTGYRTALDTMAMATRPCIFSHSMVDAVQAHFRNINDEQIKACAATGGVIGMSGSGEYIGDASCSVDGIMRHIDYIADLVGPEHIGVGLDLVFDAEALNNWIRTRPDEWPEQAHPDWPGFSYAAPELLPRLTEALLARAYTEPQVRGMLGENWVRVCKAAWR